MASDYLRLDDLRLEAERQRSAAQSGMAPDKILEMARTCPVAHAYVAMWRSGGLTFDQAVIGICLELKRQNAEMAGRLAEAMLLQAPQPVLVKEAQRQDMQAGRDAMRHRMETRKAAGQ